MRVSGSTDRTRYAITGVGIVGSFGTGRDAFRKKLAGCSDGSVKRTAALYARTDRLHDFVASHQLRRTDHFSQLALTALYLALENAGLEPVDCRESGLLVATGYGPVASTCSFKDTYFDNGSSGASPTMFTKSVHNQATSHIAVQLDLHGPVTTICQHTMPFQYALLTACLWLEEKRAVRVLVGGVDEYPPFLEYCRFRYLQEKSKNDIHLLGDVDTIPGEGAAFFVLEAKTSDSKVPFLDLPLFGDKFVQQNVALPGECFVQGGSGTQRNDWLRNNHTSGKKYDFTELYGCFPAAAALDLAALTVLLSSHKTGSHFETGPDGQFCQLGLFSSESNYPMDEP